MEKVKFEMNKLEDGTPIWISSMAVDGEVFAADENMERAQSLDGEHTLEDGTKVVTVDGKITEVIAKEEEAPAEEAPVDAEMEEVETVEETELADEVIEEAPAEVVEEAPEGDVNEAMVMEIIQPKLDEIYSVIAELKTMIESANVEEVPAEDVAMSHNEKFNTVLERLRNM